VPIPEVESRNRLIAFLKKFFQEKGASGGGDVYVSGTPANNQVSTWTDSVTIKGETGLTFDGSTLTVTGDASVTGDTTLGDASGDSVTINAATINLANIAPGTDDTVVVYDGSSLVTDEINPAVWDTSATFVDATGTPVNDQVAIWTDANTLEGSTNLTFDGTDLTVGGDLTVTGNDIKGSGGTAITMDGSNNVTIAGDLTVGGQNILAPADSNLFFNTDKSMYFDIDEDDDETDQIFRWRATNTTLMTLTEQGYLTLPNGLSSSMGTQVSTAWALKADTWIKVASVLQSTNYYATAVIDVMLAGFDTAAEIYQARVHLRTRPGSTTNSVCQVDILQDEGGTVWDATDFVLTQDTSGTTPWLAELWIRTPRSWQRCYATITNGTSDGPMSYKADWALTPGQSWTEGASPPSLGSEVTTTNVKKKFASLEVLGDISGSGQLTMEGQPAFSAFTTTGQTTVAGQWMHLSCSSEVFDVGNDYNTTDCAFTAPTDGKYMLSTSIRLDSVDSQPNQFCWLVISTSNRDYYSALENVDEDDATTYHTVQTSVLADMNAGDTAEVYFRVEKDVAASNGGNSMGVRFQGYLLG